MVAHAEQIVQFYEQAKMMVERMIRDGISIAPGEGDYVFRASRGPAPVRDN